MGIERERLRNQLMVGLDPPLQDELEKLLDRLDELVRQSQALIEAIESGLLEDVEDEEEAHRILMLIMDKMLDEES